MSAGDNRGWQPDRPDEGAAPEYQLAYPFLDPSESFAKGFECGLVVARLQMQHKFVRRVIRAVNVPQLVLAAKHYGYTMSTQKESGTGEYVKLTAVRTSDTAK